MIENTLNLEFIVTRRKSLGLTQGEMATKLGLNSAPAYNKYEKGVYKFNADKVPLIAKVLQCEINDIFLTKKLTN